MEDVRNREGKSMLLAISNKKTIAYKLIKGPVNGEHLYDFLINNVINGRTDIKILLDNARTHHYCKIKEKNKRNKKSISI